MAGFRLHRANGVIVQGGLIRPLTRRFSLRGMMLAGTALTGIGISSIPYASADMSMLIFWSFCASFAIGNGIYSPTQSSLLTFASKNGGYELGTIMGAQEGLGALYPRAITIGIQFKYGRGEGLWSYHTCFRVSGLFFLVALLQLRYEDQAVKPIETSRMSVPAVVAHGGAGPRPERLANVKRAVAIAAVLVRGSAVRLR